MSGNRLEKLPHQKKDEAKALRTKSEEFVEIASELRKELRDKRSLDMSAVLVIFRTNLEKAKPTKADRELNITELSLDIMRGISNMKRYAVAHPEMEPYGVGQEQAYVFPYALPKKVTK